MTVQDIVEQSFNGSHPRNTLTKIWISGKRNWIYTAYTFWVAGSTSALRYPSEDHFGRISTKIYGKQGIL